MQIPAEGEANATAMYKTEYDLEQYIRTVSTPNSAFSNDYGLDEMARRENKSNQSRFSSLERENEEKAQEKITHLKNAFAKAGFSSEVIYDTEIDGFGEIEPGDATRPKHITIRVNPNTMREDTIYHEFGHAYIDLLGINHPAVVSAIEALRGTELYKKVEIKYPDLQGDTLDK